MRPIRLSQPPRALRQAKFDNLALVPGSVLPLKTKYQQIANSLPTGDVLIILPLSDTPLKKTLQALCNLFRAKGQKVTTISVEKLAEPLKAPLTL